MSVCVCVCDLSNGRTRTQAQVSRPSETSAVIESSKLLILLSCNVTPLPQDGDGAGESHRHGWPRQHQSCQFPHSQWEWTANLTILTCLETAKPFAESANSQMSHHIMQKNSSKTEFLCRRKKAVLMLPYKAGCQPRVTMSFMCFTPRLICKGEVPSL